MSPTKSLLYHQEKGIARITFNRPEAHNALSKDLLQELAALLDNVRGNDAVSGLILTGAEDKAFSAGADIKSADDCLY